ncbi:MAG: hypothetical protein EB059_01420 [Alphaproteobacteria bacterium]|nr:hypothetical protein [Alphaproteobacteria bacterium]
MLVLLANDIFGGVIKYYTARSSLLFLSFLPVLFAGGVVGAYYLLYGFAMRWHKAMGVFLLLFLFNAIYAMFIGRQPMAVGFALYIWLPFFLGMLVAIFKCEESFQKYVLMCWLCAIAGVFLNSQIDFPWVGEDYQAFGKTLQTSREWWAQSIFRIAGFSRASFAASNQIALFCMVMLCLPMGRWKKFGIWALSIIAVYLTTSKIALLIMIITPLLILLVQASAKKTGRPAYALLFTLTAIMVLAPILLLTTRSQVGTFDGFGFLTLSSMFERMYWMWPSAWDLLFKDNNPVLMVLGRGLGGIGTPQTFFETLYQNSADNLFIYLYVTFGIGSFIFIYYLMKSLRRCASNTQSLLMYFTFSIVVVMIGMTANVVENSTSLLVFGMLMGKASEPIRKNPPYQRLAS